MKEMAAEMHRELETTRAELRRGVFELPQETAESAAQMRRVIVDQIEALAELNRIVARHGRNLDAVEPVRRVREEPTLAVIGGGRNEPAARSEVPPRNESPSRNEGQLRNEMPSRSETPPRGDSPPRPVQRSDTGGGFAPAARRGSETPSPAATPIAPGRGWLSDLLTRASREETEPQREFPREPARESAREPAPARGSEERPPRHTIESLDSLSVDIAPMRLPTSGTATSVVNATSSPVDSIPCRVNRPSTTFARNIAQIANSSRR
jgi:hypothetical protein